MFARSGALLAVMNEGKFRGIDRVQVIGGPLYVQKRPGARFVKEVHFVEAATGDPVVKVVRELFGGGDRVWNGTNDGLEAGLALHLVGDMWGPHLGGSVLRLLVDGRNLGNAVMSAVDQSGAPLLRFRAEPGMPSRFFPNENEPRVDVVLSPYLQPAPQLFLIAALASPHLVRFFKKAQGGE
jgi:hypothetical protein